MSAWYNYNYYSRGEWRRTTVIMIILIIYTCDGAVALLYIIYTYLRVVVHTTLVTCKHNKHNIVHTEHTPIRYMHYLQDVSKSSRYYNIVQVVYTLASEG